MTESAAKKTFLQRLWLILVSVGPGIFCIGYTIGTGSVTSMAKAGSQFGMQLLWVLSLSCLFAWVLMESYGRFAIVTGRTAMHAFKTEIRFGKVLAVLTIFGVVTAQWNSLTGILGLSSGAIFEGIMLFMPGLELSQYWTVLGIAVAIICILYAFLLVGRYSFFEKILVFFVTLMGISFIFSLFIVLPSPAEIAAGFVPRIPKTEGGMLMVAAFVGTTMAAPTFVVRPLLMQGKGWSIANSKDQSRDAFISALLMFVISASVMGAATGALHHRGLTITKVLDMVTTLEPVAGRYAVAVFLTGTLSAGLSSVFPILMVAPLLISDYRAGVLDMRSTMFRILTGIACLFGLIVPIFGANPIAAQIATQVAGVFVLPLVIAGIAYLVNRKDLMGDYRAGLLLNIGLGAAFVFSCIISYTGILALMKFFR